MNNKEFKFGEFTLIVNEHGFSLVDNEFDACIVDASTIGHTPHAWIELLPPNNGKFIAYANIRTDTGAYNLGIAKRKKGE